MSTPAARPEQFYGRFHSPVGRMRSERYLTLLWLVVEGEDEPDRLSDFEQAAMANNRNRLAIKPNTFILYSLRIWFFFQLYVRSRLRFVALGEIGAGFASRGNIFGASIR